MTNFAEGVGIYSRQHALAVRTTEILVSKLKGRSLSLTGHSLGGGLASLAASKWGLTARTFNAAGLSKGTLSFHSIRQGADSNVQAYYVKGELLHFAQQQVIAPAKLGNQIALESTRVVGFPQFPIVSGMNRYRMHGIDDVIKGLEGKRAWQK
ncbi:lipase family protein [Alteromonas sp. a30]|uniref:lipase family protein n=1 Tax=Alteromonas sp. a30 TaxID=2730917 RepID=UPI00227F85EF|nr:hypothetical protein [Alteromonas sp. a30]MCY7297524.1 hypothetical protein [Alteromonas sp. a30]